MRVVRQMESFSILLKLIWEGVFIVVKSKWALTVSDFVNLLNDRIGSNFYDCPVATIPYDGKGCVVEEYRVLVFA